MLAMYQGNILVTRESELEMKQNMTEFCKYF